MKYTNIRSFEKHLIDASPKHFAELYLIINKDPFQRKESADHLAASILSEEAKPSLAIKSFDATQNDIEEILQELSSLSFFSKRRAVVIYNVEKFVKAQLEKIDAYIARPNPGVYLILTASAVHASSNFLKACAKAGIILDVAEEKAWEKEKSAQEWLVNKALSEGKKIDPQAAISLIKQTGPDPATLTQELQKLICYIGDRPQISVKDIEAVCATINQENIWQLGEAIFRKDTGTALRISKALLEDGTVLLSLLRQLRSQFQTDYQVCCLLANGGSPLDVQQQFPYMRGNILERHLQMSRTYGQTAFKSGIIKIDEAEQQIKNSSADPDLINEILILKLTS